MSDHKQKTRAKLLNELESIKDLLNADDELAEFEPPLLTAAIDDIESVPLLTEIQDEAGAGISDDAIPVLQEKIESQEPESLVELEPEQSPDQVAEEQPSLFEASDNEANKLEPSQEEQVPLKPVAVTLATGRGENPFLPKHIRERLTANRKNQAAMMESLAPLPRPALPPTKPASVGLADEQQLIDELVQRFLPEIEAALRERLQAVIREERNASEGDTEN